MFDNKIVAIAARLKRISGSGSYSLAHPLLLRMGRLAGGFAPDVSKSVFSSWFACMVGALFLCSPVFSFSPAEAATDSSQIRARALFSLLPPNIFENTSEGLNDEEFETLVEEGHTEYWSISHDSANELVVSAVPPVESKVVLHLFRSESGGVVAALGSQSGIVCALEFWRYDGAGKIIPMAGPEQPPISDLFLPNHLPSSIDPTIMMCLEQDKILAKPILWSANGIVNEPQDFIVHYFWNGREFIKDRKAVQPLPSNPAPAGQPNEPSPESRPVPLAAPQAILEEVGNDPAALIKSDTSGDSSISRSEAGGPATGPDMAISTVTQDNAATQTHLDNGNAVLENGGGNSTAKY